MSAALKRRFNIIALPTPDDVTTEIEIVQKRVRELATNLDLKAALPTQEAVRKVVTIFRELRSGTMLDGKEKIKPPSGIISTKVIIYNRQITCLWNYLQFKGILLFAL